MKVLREEKDFVIIAFRRPFARAKTSKDIEKQIRDERKKGKSYRAIARVVHVSYWTISRVLNEKETSK